MAIEKNWLLLTNYSGVLQIVPLGNKNLYAAQNRVIKKHQYKFREMTYQEAVDFVEKHNGRDPDFITPARATNLISEKDRQIEELKAQLAALQTPDRPSPMKVPQGIDEAANRPGPAQEITQEIKRGPGRPKNEPIPEMVLPQ